MKIWYGHGSEHSTNLVMIGEFKEAEIASEAKEAISLLIKQVMKDDQEGLINWDEPSTRYSEEMLSLLSQLKVYSINPTDIKQFAFDAKIEVDDTRIRISTDEIDVQAFLKVLIDRGARVEIFSAHDYPNNE